MRRSRGFTLVELLVALFALALLAALSWQGLDGMLRAQRQTQRHADDVLALQTGLSQWNADLEALVQFDLLPALDWNGRVLRLTRRDTVDVTAGAHVVGWALRQGQWRRWQSPPLVTRGDVQAAWLQADQWAQGSAEALRQQEVAIAPLLAWELFYFRDNAWSHPLSSAGGVPPNPQARLAEQLPDGVRLVLQLPPGQALAGRVAWDWVRPTVGGAP